MEVTAKLNYLHMAPRKVRLVATLVKGMNISRARRELSHISKRCGPPLLKLLNSAVANASHNFQLEENGLYVKDARVDAGPVAKRMRARAFGRGATIHKRTSHVMFVLGTLEDRETATNRRKANPVVREASSEDTTTIDARKPRAKNGRQNVSSGKSPGFARKMFRRKVI